MSSLSPKPPFVWPEPRALERTHSYEHQPPFGELVQGSRSMFGFVSAPTSRGVKVIKTWMERNVDLKATLIVVVYPTCATQQTDLTQLLALVEGAQGRLSVHVLPLNGISDQATGALCFLTSESDAVWMVTGSSENLGLESCLPGQAHFVFQADPLSAEGFKRHFDWTWAHSRNITTRGATQIPHLVLPEGTDEGQRLWQTYTAGWLAEAPTEDQPRVIAQVDPETGDVTLQSEDGKPVAAPTEEIGFAKLDELAERMTRLYGKGALVSIDKLSRIPPLDSPLDPGLFGDASELHKGNVSRKVSMRVSVIDAKMLKEIDKRRQGIRTLLAKFTFGLADGMRWMPFAARGLCEAELNRMNAEGQTLIGELLKGDVAAFLVARRPALVADINAMHTELGRQGPVAESVIDRVVASLKERLDKAHSASFMPMLSYSTISFDRTNTELVSPWGQAYSLLASVAAYQREAVTDNYFFSGIKVPEDDLIDAMNVADDVLRRDERIRNRKDRCKREQEMLSRIEVTPMEARSRCELVCRIIDGEPLESIDIALEKLVAS